MGSGRAPILWLWCVHAVLFRPRSCFPFPPIINLHAQNHQSHIISHVSFPTGQAYFKKTIIYRSFPPTKMRILLCLLLLLISCTTALYDNSDEVVELTAGNFHKRVLDDDAIWVVEFYAPWFGPKFRTFFTGIFSDFPPILFKVRPLQTVGARVPEGGKRFERHCQSGRR
jgi:hypothetical protein